MLGLLSVLRRKNCWTIAEQAGDVTPDGMQHLLAAARWDAGGPAETQVASARHLGRVRPCPSCSGCMLVMPQGS